MKDFAVFILSHGRADNVQTLRTLERYGYTGDWYIIVDNEDDTIGEYEKNFGKEHIVVFNKLTIKRTFDTMDNFEDRRTIVYARNACFDIAREMGYRHFVELDDDYYYFGIRTEDGACAIRNLDEVFSLLVDFVDETGVASVAFSQGGDHIGGYDPKKLCKRKAMNSFVCATDRPFRFIGRINEDVNTYVRLGSIGYVFLTIMNLQLDQRNTQENGGGMTDVYMDSGTYVKTFYSVITNPSCVKIKTIGNHHRRIHHSIAWDNAVPKIISEKYKQ